MVNISQHVNHVNQQLTSQKHIIIIGIKYSFLLKEIREKNEPLNCPDSLLLSCSRDDWMRQPYDWWIEGECKCLLLIVTYFITLPTEVNPVNSGYVSTFWTKGSCWTYRPGILRKRILRAPHQVDSVDTDLAINSQAQYSEYCKSQLAYFF